MPFKGIVPFVIPPSGLPGARRGRTVPDMSFLFFFFFFLSISVSTLFPFPVSWDVGSKTTLVCRSVLFRFLSVHFFPFSSLGSAPHPVCFLSPQVDNPLQISH